MPQKDAEVQLQNAAAIVNQWHAAYMEVADPTSSSIPGAHVFLPAQIPEVISPQARDCSQGQ